MPELQVVQNGDKSVYFEQNTGQSLGVEKNKATLSPSALPAKSRIARMDGWRGFSNIS